MNTNLKILLKKYINKNICEIYIDNLYKINFQYISNINLMIEDYIIIFYKNSIIIVSIDTNNEDIFNSLNYVINLKNIKIFDELKEIKKVFIINIDTNYFHNKENCINIEEIKLKINCFTLKNNNIYELFISLDIYDHLAMIKHIIDNNIDY